MPAADQDEVAAWGAVPAAESHYDAYVAADRTMTAYFHRLVAAE